MVNAQEWLNEKYPKEQRAETKSLNLSKRYLEGDLDLTDFTNLEEVDVSKNKLTNLNLTGLSKLEKLHCWNNELADLNLTNCFQLKEINCHRNILANLDLVNCFWNN